MGRPTGRPGKRVNIYLDPASLKVASQIDNLSEFFQIALAQAVSIMAFDIIKKEKGVDQPLPSQEEYDRWNQDHPLDPLTQKRLNKCNTPNSQPKQELW